MAATNRARRPVDAPPGGAAPSVDELFARIRAASDDLRPHRGRAGASATATVATAVVIDVEEEIELGDR